MNSVQCTVTFCVIYALINIKNCIKILGNSEKNLIFANYHIIFFFWLVGYLWIFNIYVICLLNDICWRYDWGVYVLHCMEYLLIWRDDEMQILYHCYHYILITTGKLFIVTSYSKSTMFLHIKNGNKQNKILWYSNENYWFF